MSRFPEKFQYTKDHEWAYQDGGTVTVGITDHAQSALGDIVFVDLPQPGRILKPGEVFGVVESIKAVSELYSPLAGKVLEVNPDLAQDPGKINQDPHGSGWLLKLQPTEAGSNETLMNVSQYQELVDSL